MSRVEAFRKDIVRYSHRIHAAGWVANHDGNLSARLDDGRLLCTPTAVSKGDVQSGWLIVVDDDGAVVEGSRRAFSELQLHRAAYAARPDISVVIHSHPPVCCGYAVAGVPLPYPLLAEPVVSLGPSIPMVPYIRTGRPELPDAIGTALQSADVLLLERHGVLAVGGSFEQAYLRMELLEHQAKIAMNASVIGQIRLLPQSEIEALSQRGRPPSMPARPTAAAAAPPSAGQGRQVQVQPNVASMVDDALKRFS